MTQLVIVLVTALVTIFTIWFGSYLTRKNDAEKWRRDHALQAYWEFLGAMEAVAFEADAAYYGSDCGTEKHVKQGGLILEKVAEMYRIEQRVILVAPDEVNARLRPLALHVGTEIGAKLSKCPKIDESELKAARAKYAELLVSFTNAARNDLGIHLPLRTLEEWSKTPKKPWRQRV
jgi:hypothetical protein